MLTTEEMLTYACHEFKVTESIMNKRLIFFTDKYLNAPEGEYFFEKDDYYYCIGTEKGSINFQLQTRDLQEILWEILSCLSLKTIADYALAQKKKGFPYFEAMHEKELEIFNDYSEAFGARKRQEIEQREKELTSQNKMKSPKS